jgi:hypothetical protein
MPLFAQIAVGAVLSVLLLRYLPLIVRVGALLLLGFVVVFVWVCLWPVIGAVRWQVVRFQEGRRVPPFEFKSSSTDGIQPMSVPLARAPQQLSEQRVGGSDPRHRPIEDLVHTDDTDEAA